MTPKTILLLDTETSSLDPKTGHLLEVGAVIWSVEHATTIACASWLLGAPSNEAEHINGIPVGALAYGRAREQVVPVLRKWAGPVDAIVAHNAEFDASWLPEVDWAPWICSCHDISWPGGGRAGAIERERERPGQSLVALCLAHGVGVASAHRAITDCLLLARLFERVAELGHDVGVLLERAMRPKVKVVSLAPFERKDEVRSKGFRWDEKARVWWRSMPEDDVSALPFPTRIVTEQRRAAR